MKPEKQKKNLKQIIREITRKVRKVWIKASQVEEHKDLIAKAEYYGIKVFIAKNVLEENVFKHNGIAYISEIESGIQKRNFTKDV